MKTAERTISRSRGNSGSPPVTRIFASLGAAFQHPALWFTLSMIANVGEGALRKWTPGFDAGIGRNLAYFSKDIFFVFGVAMVFGRDSQNRLGLREAATWGKASLALILLGAGLSSLAGFNAAGSALSFRALVVLPVVGYLFATRVSRFPLAGFAIVAVLLATINAPLSLIQSGLPANHVLNKYASDEMQVVEVVSGVRATGTAAYIVGLGVFAALGTWGGMVLLSVGQNWKLRTVGSLGILAGFACAFSSGSRSSLVMLAAMLGIWALSSNRARTVLRQSMALVLGLALGALVAFPQLAERFSIMGAGVVDRFQSAGDSNAERAFGQWSELWYAVIHHPFGTGPGTEQVGGNYVASGVAGFTQYENQFPRIVAEFGVIGFVGFLLLIIATMIALQKNRKSDRYWRWNLIVTATQVTLLGQFYNSLVFNHTASAMVWLVATAVLAAAPVTKRKSKSGPRKKRVIRTRDTEAGLAGLESPAGIEREEPVH